LPARSASGSDRLAATFALLALAALAVPAAAEQAAAPGATARGAIRGRVEAPREPPHNVPRPSVDALGQPAVPGASDRLRSVVYLESAPLGAFEQADLPRVVMDQRNQTFLPYVLAVPVGTTVDFPNNDSTYHNVFSLSKARRFDLGRYPRGLSRAVRFDRPGVVRVFCEIHSHMSAFILVFAHPYFALTDEGGRYRIERVPPGSYRLVVWHEGREREVREVQLGEGEIVQADFVVK
jgi:plastocyanin